MKNALLAIAVTTFLLLATETASAGPRHGVVIGGGHQPHAANFGGRPNGLGFSNGIRTSNNTFIWLGSPVVYYIPPVVPPVAYPARYGHYVSSPNIFITPTVYSPPLVFSYGTPARGFGFRNGMQGGWNRW
jgi:hypothetical protein